MDGYLPKGEDMTPYEIIVIRDNRSRIAGPAYMALVKFLHEATGVPQYELTWWVDGVCLVGEA